MESVGWKKAGMFLSSVGLRKGRRPVMGAATAFEGKRRSIDRFGAPLIIYS